MKYSFLAVSRTRRGRMVQMTTNKYQFKFFMLHLLLMYIYIFGNGLTTSLI